MVERVAHYSKCLDVYRNVLTMPGVGYLASRSLVLATKRLIKGEPDALRVTKNMCFIFWVPAEAKERNESFPNYFLTMCERPDRIGA